MSNKSVESKAAKTAFCWPVRVYYEDTDAGGVVFYANYLKFFERARTEMLRAAGIEQDIWLDKDIAFVVRKVEMDNKKAARFNEQLIVSCTVANMRGASILFEQDIRGIANALICTGKFKIACIKLSTMTPVAIPDEIVNALANKV